ncbi:hypothetical protein ACFQ1Q_12710 [Winogradskyella litorisediminis]|uniref:Uncharacterized protein n=1 Tax=Winogradskyella litorisediminis TaxID=1156618 RepID=A0ABW3N9F2_9FLAO
MEQNLKDLFKNQPEDKSTKMSQGHEERFLQKLETALPKKRKSTGFGFLNIAASVIVLLGLSYGGFLFFGQETIEPIIPNDVVKTKEIKSMGDFSPQLKKVEDYYLASINLELSKVKLTPENKDLVDGYIERLKDLNTEYQNLTVELNENGPNTETLEALIDNLRIRLNLVTQLKEKLDEFNIDSFKEQRT